MLQLVSLFATQYGAHPCFQISLFPFHQVSCHHHLVRPSYQEMENQLMCVNVYLEITLFQLLYQ